MRLHTAILAAGLALPGLAAPAAPARYLLQPDISVVSFETGGQTPVSGTFPVRSAEIVLDFDRLANCSIAVVLDVSGARTSFPFAAEAMKSASVLDAREYPQMRFTSEAVAATKTGARVKGRLTIRGVTRPVTLEAAILRQAGTGKGDLSHLTVRLTGTVRRSDYGATGWDNMVSDEVRITITARIARDG